MRLQGRCGHLTRVKTASAAAVVFALGSAPAPASAEGLFSWLFGGGQQRFQASPSAPMHAMRYRAAHKPSTRNAQTAIDTDTPTSSTSASKASKAEKAEAVETHGPLFVVVSLNDEHIRVYDDHGLVTSSIVSTGVEGHPTPKGIFTILGR
jgi:lipoprotein-anchoring transpeptidase ErfK/SrfK